VYYVTSSSACSSDRISKIEETSWKAAIWKTVKDMRGRRYAYVMEINCELRFGWNWLKFCPMTDFGTSGIETSVLLKES